MKGREVLSPKFRWQEEKLGIGPPPLEIEEKVMMVFHGVDPEKVYRVGVVFMIMRDNLVLFKELADPILEPEAPYERKGEVENVVFPCGAIKQKDRILIYYGGGDRVVGLAILNLEEIIELLKG